MQENQEDFKNIKDFLAGSEAAFNLIARKYQPKIYWHARRMLNNHDDADEIVQEVLLTMYRKLSSFKFQSSLYTWIYKITSTRCLNLIAKTKIKRFISTSEPDIVNLQTKEDIVKNIQDKEKLDKIHEILKDLPEKQREIFILRNFEQLSYEEISKITGKSEGGLKANYFHAFAKISEKLKDESKTI